MMSPKRKGGLETTSIVDYKAFKFYREKTKLRDKENTPNYVEHGKILSKFYKKIGEAIVKSEGGVVIENLGYFSGIVDTVKSYPIFVNTNSILLNRRTSGYKFFLIFIPLSKDDLLREWVADSSFTSKIKKSFSNALNSGVKFTFNPQFFIKKYKIK